MFALVNATGEFVGKVDGVFQTKGFDVNTSAKFETRSAALYVAAMLKDQIGTSFQTVSLNVFTVKASLGRSINVIMLDVNERAYSPEAAKEAAKRLIDAGYMRVEIHFC